MQKAKIEQENAMKKQKDAEKLARNAAETLARLNKKEKMTLLKGKIFKSIKKAAAQEAAGITIKRWFKRLKRTRLEHKRLENKKVEKTEYPTIETRKMFKPESNLTDSPEGSNEELLYESHSSHGSNRSEVDGLSFNSSDTESVEGIFLNAPVVEEGVIAPLRRNVPHNAPPRPARTFANTNTNQKVEVPALDPLARLEQLAKERNKEPRKAQLKPEKELPREREEIEEPREPALEREQIEERKKEREKEARLEELKAKVEKAFKGNEKVTEKESQDENTLLTVISRKSSEAEVAVDNAEDEMRVLKVTGGLAVRGEAKKKLNKLKAVKEEVEQEQGIVLDKMNQIYRNRVNRTIEKLNVTIREIAGVIASFNCICKLYFPKEEFLTIHTVPELVNSPYPKEQVDSTPNTVWYYLDQYHALILYVVSVTKFQRELAQIFNQDLSKRFISTNNTVKDIAQQNFFKTNHLVINQKIKELGYYVHERLRTNPYVKFKDIASTDIDYRIKRIKSDLTHMHQAKIDLETKMKKLEASMPQEKDKEWTTKLFDAFRQKFDEGQYQTCLNSVLKEEKIKPTEQDDKEGVFRIFHVMREIKGRTTSVGRGYPRSKTSSLNRPPETVVTEQKNPMVDRGKRYEVNLNEPESEPNPLLKKKLNAIRAAEKIKRQILAGKKVNEAQERKGIIESGTKLNYVGKTTGTEIETQKQALQPILKTRPLTNFV